MNERDPIDRLRGAEWPSPSAELRARVAATPVKAPAIMWSDRVWYSGRWRVAFAATALAVVLLDLFAARGSAPVAPAAAQAETQEIEEFVRLIGLSDEAAAALARRARIVVGTPALDRAALISGGN